MNFHQCSLVCCDLFSHFSLCISDSGSVYSFGNSRYGAHGQKEFTSFPKQIKNLTDIIMVDCGSNHSLYLDINGYVYSFGRNDKGQLGIGKSKTELEYSYIPQQLNLPIIKKICCGSFFSTCLSQEGNCFSFGENTSGELGFGNNINCNFPKQIPDLYNVEFIISRGLYSICKTYDGDYYSWGVSNGKLGQGNNNSCNKPTQCLNWPDNIIDIKCGYCHSLLLTSSGTVYSFGKNTYGELGLSGNNRKVKTIPTLINDLPEIKRIECGANFSMCIDVQDYLWVFGYNRNGHLGLGDTNNKYKPIKHPLVNVIDISSGGGHTFVKTLDNNNNIIIYGFGYNCYGQIGINTIKNQLTPIQVLKNNENIWKTISKKSRSKSARK